jgi:hypothetical protein
VFVCIVLYFAVFFFLVAVGAMPEGRCFCRRRTKDKGESSETCQSTTSSTDAPFLPRSLPPSLPSRNPAPSTSGFFWVQICEVGGVGDHSQEDLAKFGYSPDKKVKKSSGNCAKIVLPTYQAIIIYLNMEN